MDGSLRNTEEGFEFELKNMVAPTTFISLGPIEIDGEPYAADEVTVTASKPRQASAVSDKSPLLMPMGKVINIRIPGDALVSGEHEIIVHAVTREVGPVMIGVTENL